MVKNVLIRLVQMHSASQRAAPCAGDKSHRVNGPVHRHRGLRALAPPPRTPALSGALGLPRFPEFHPKIVLTQESPDPSLFHSIDFTPCLREFQSDSKKPINNPTLKTKWTLGKRATFVLSLLSWEILS